VTHPLSVFLITRNEEARLGRTLDAVAWADQVVVVDSGSRDATCEIARAKGAEVHHRDWTGYGAQKSYAEGLCRNDWVLNIDADEVVTPELAAEIRAFLATNSAPAAFRVRVRNVYPGDDRPRPFASDYNIVRFYHRAAGSYRNHPLFDRVELEEGIVLGQLKAPIHHFAHLSLAHFIDKENRYTSYVAETARPRSRLWLMLRLPFELPLAFLKFYFLRGHITGGWKGFAFATAAAFMRMIRIAKLLEVADQQRRKD